MPASLSQPSPAERAPLLLPGVEPIVIVGAGPAGVRAAEELLARHPTRPIVLYGDEPWEPYQRVRLSSLLAGEIDRGAIDNRPRLPSEHRVVQRYHCSVVAIQRVRRRVRDATGREQPYAKLILATGSRPHLPDVPGIARAGVYTFRDLNDVQRLMARSVRTRRTIVLGGGLLGIEAARALLRHSTAVTLVQHGVRLMNRQLDDTAGAWLRQHVESLGVRVVLNDSVRAVLGAHGVERVQLLSGQMLECDTLVVAAGIRPNTELAFAAGLSVGWGVRVDDRMQTSDPDIYAVGECAEHRGRVIGLAAPGLEQAAVAAHNLTGGNAFYEGSIAATDLKVVGLPVFSVGETGDDENPLEQRFLTYAKPDEGIYRKLILRNRRLVGAIAIGAWSELAALQEAVTRRRRLGLAVAWRFRRRGRLWAAPGEDGVAFWPAAATVCNCATVSRGRLTDAVARGCASVECLGEATGAGRVCGSCRPLLAELVGTQAQPVVAPGRNALLGATLATLLLLLAFYWPGSIAPLASVQAGAWPQRLWTDGVWKQVSGYTLFGLGLVGLTLSLRKRWSRCALGAYGWWRVAHVTLGLGALAVLVAHTGLNPGNNLNLYLLLSFLALTKLGSLAGTVVALETRPSRASRRLKAVTTWAHILLVWPLPALLGFHILSVYYF
jgi:nitrite reductase (NADH) large subunit